MNTLVINNNISIFKTDDDGLRNELWQKLRVKSLNCFYNAAYKNKVWDGFVDFYKKESGRFLTGLLPDIMNFLKDKNLHIQVKDNRKVVEFENLKISADFITHEGKTLRDYQIEYVEKVAKHKRGIILAPTSSGKTMTMAAIIKNIPAGLKVLVLAGKIGLVDQNYEEILKFTGRTDIGKFYGKIKEINTIVCATAQSLKRPEIQEWLTQCDVLIVDEIHENMSARAKKIFSSLNNCSIRIGLSATPFKDGGKDKQQKFEVKGWIGPVIKLSEEIAEDGNLTVGVLQKRNILASVQCDFFKVSEPPLPLATYADAVQYGIAGNMHLHNMVKDLVESLEGRTLIIVDRIEHGDTLADMIPNALWIRGQDNLETRKDIVTKLSTSEGKVVAIASSGIFNTGINVFVHNLINSSGGKSEHVVLQRFGRGLRVCADKPHLNYYDFVFTCNDYLYSHSQLRTKILKKQGHNVVVHDNLHNYFVGFKNE